MNFTLSLIVLSIILSTIFTLGVCTFFFHSEAKKIITFRECVTLVILMVFDWLCLISELVSYLF